MTPADCAQETTSNACGDRDASRWTGVDEPHGSASRKALANLRDSDLSFFRRRYGNDLTFA
jgi:hypothetical protein